MILGNKFATRDLMRDLSAVVVVADRPVYTRDLMRDLSEAVNYYVLVVTSENARLLVGTNGTLIKEVVGDSPRQEVHDELAFPIKNTTLPTGSKSDRTGSSDDHSYLKRVYESCG